MWAFAVAGATIIVYGCVVVAGLRAGIICGGWVSTPTLPLAELVYIYMLRQIFFKNKRAFAPIPITVN